MKKILLIIFFLCSFYGIAHSQVATPNGYTTNYGFRKYAEGAHAGADSLNANLDDIDTEIKNSRNASNLTTGTLSNARLANTVFTTSNLDTAHNMHLDDNQTINGAKTFKNSGNIFYGDGSNLTGINITSVIDTSQVGFLNQRNTWAKRQLFSDSMRTTGIVNMDSAKIANRTTTNNLTVTTDATVGNSLTVTGAVIAGDYTGSGTLLTDLDASNIEIGSLDDSRLSANVALLNASNAFTGTLNTFNAVKTKTLYSDVTTISVATIDCSLGNNFTQAITGNKTYTFTNFTAGQVVNVAITSTSGSPVVTWTGVTWSGGSQPTQTTTSGKTDLWSFIKVGSTIYGSVISNF